MSDKSRRLFLESIGLGVVGAGAALFFDYLLHVMSWLFMTLWGGVPQSAISSGVLTGYAHNWWMLLIPAVGGLITGWMVYTYAPEAEGHGTDTAVKAFHQSAGEIRGRVPVIKTIASAITIGSGGSAGREGPTALIAAGVGSVYAQLTKRPPVERRLLLLAGMAAGLSAIFRSPIGTAVFAVEVLYSRMEFDAGALVYCLMSSVVAYALTVVLEGPKALFSLPQIQAPRGWDYLYYVVLGVASGFVALLLPWLFYKVRDLFAAIPISNVFKPAIGGLAVGCLGWFFPQVLGGGYGVIEQALQGHLALKLMACLVPAKLLAFSLTVSSGGSGGVFAPTLFIGAMLGGALALVTHHAALAAPLAVVGMAAVFAGAARVPLATVLMVTEMTGGYDLLAPAALAVLISFLLQTWLSANWKYFSLYEAQVAERTDSPAHMLESLENAMAALGRGPRHYTREIRQDLIRLLRRGTPIALQGQRVTIETLEADHPWMDETLASVAAEDENLEVIAVLRRRHILPLAGGTKLHHGDQLVLARRVVAGEHPVSADASTSTGESADNASKATTTGG